MRIARRIAVALRASAFAADGVNLFLADGEVAGQEVPHVHVHVIPRTAGDGFRIATGPIGGPAPARDVLDQQAAGHPGGHRRQAIDSLDRLVVGAQAEAPGDVPASSPGPSAGALIRD